MANNQNKDLWRLESFTKTGKIVPLIVIAAVFVLTINGIVIIVLHVQEKREDSKNRP